MKLRETSHCPNCERLARRLNEQDAKVRYAPMREAAMKAGLFGPRLTALIAFMKGISHASFATIRKFFRDVVRVDVSRGC